MRETVDDHDGFVMWMVDARSFDDDVRLRGKADMMCSAGQGTLVGVWPMR
jgi:hypothetical protein